MTLNFTTLLAINRLYKAGKVLCTFPDVLWGYTGGNTEKVKTAWTHAHLEERELQPNHVPRFDPLSVEVGSRSAFFALVCASSNTYARSAPSSSCSGSVL